MMKIALHDLHGNLSTTVASVHHTGDPMVITRFGKPYVALVPISWLEAGGGLSEDDKPVTGLKMDERLKKPSTGE